MCGRNFGENSKEKKNMDYGLFRKIIDQCRGKMELAVLHAGGEPLLHPRIFDMIRYTKESGIGAWMSTNATLLDKEKAVRLLESNLDGLVLSIDAITAKVYEKIRVGGNFERTKANILRFLDIRKQRKSNMLATIQLIEMEENKHEIEGFRKFWSQYDVNIIVKPLVNWNINSESDMKYPSIRCDRPWYWLFIRSTGLVPPCGHDYDMEVVFGDLNKSSVEEVWNSSVACAFRESIIDGKHGHPVCSHCDYAPARKRGWTGNIAQCCLDMLTICKILFWVGYNKVDRKGL